MRRLLIIPLAFVMVLSLASALTYTVNDSVNWGQDTTWGAFNTTNGTAFNNGVRYELVYVPSIIPNFLRNGTMTQVDIDLIGGDATPRVVYGNYFFTDGTNRTVSNTITNFVTYQRFNFSNPTPARNVFRFMINTSVNEVYARNLSFNITGGDSELYVNVNAPRSGHFITNQIFNFTASTYNANLTNLTLYVWNSSNSIINTTSVSINGTLNITSITLNQLSPGNYSFNGFACGIDNSSVGLCRYVPTNTSFFYGYLLNNQTYSTPVGELSESAFSINITLPSTILSSDAYLVYNNTEYLANKVTYGTQTIYNRTITTPDVSATSNFSFYWRLHLTDSVGLTIFNVTSLTNQTVTPILIDNCTNFTTRILNYTMYDEDSQAFLNGTSQNTSIQLTVDLYSPSGSLASTFSKTYNNTNPAFVCFQDSILNSSTYRMYATARYVSANRVVEYNYIQNYSLNNNTIPNNVALYDLAISNSQEFLITYRDSTLIPVSDALITIQRFYTGEGLYKTVEAPETDIDGKTLGHMVLGDEVYTIIVSKEGRLLSTYTNIRPVCQNQAIGECKINLDDRSSVQSFDDFINNLNVAYSTSWNATSGLYQLLFSTTDSTSKTVNLTITNSTSYLCSTQVTSSGGLLLCPAVSNASQTALVTVTVDGTLLYQEYISLIANNIYSNPFTYILAGALILGISMFAITSGALMIIFFVFAVVSAGSLYLLDTGGLVGTTSVITIILALAIVLLIKSTRRTN